MAKRIAVVGAGLLGRLLAWRLLRADHQVSLFEATPFSHPRSAAHTAAAMVSPFSEVVVSNKTLFNIGLHSLKLWPQWLEALNGQLTAQKTVAYANPGTLVVAHAQDQSELQQFKQDLQGLLGSDDRSQWLDAAAIVDRESGLLHFHRALYLPDEAYLDNRGLLAQLLSVIDTMGATCFDNCPIKDCRNATRQFQPENFDTIIDCRGMGAKHDWPGLRGVRGEVLWVHCPEVQFKHAIRLMHPRYKLYLVPKPDHHYIIGATEIESEDLSPISLQSNLELASALYTIHPAFAEARIVETDVNLRPAFVDNEPTVQLRDKLIRVNGLHRHGYLLAPAMVDDIVNVISGEQASPYWSYYQRSE